MNKLSKEKKDKLTLIGLVTVGIVVVLYFFVISSQRAKLTEYAEKTDAAVEKLRKAELWLRKAPGVASVLDENMKMLESRQEGLAPVDKFKWLYNTLDSFLGPYATQLIDITREPEIGSVGLLPKYPYDAAIFGVKFRGSYHEFGRFLADFENQFPFMRVQDLELKPEGPVHDATRGLQDGGAGVSQELIISLRLVTLIKPNPSL